MTPLTSETEWIDFLRSTPSWEPPRSPILLISPHPDDETLGAGGLIAACRLMQIKVTVVAVTDGENAYPGACEASALGRLRGTEQTNALARLNVTSDQIIRLGLPDGDVAKHEQELIDRLAPLVSADTHIIAPWSGDFHPDHVACGRAAEAIAEMTGAQLSSYFFWTWHRGVPQLLQELPLRRFALSSSLLLAKRDALACHRSQLECDFAEPILPLNLLAPAERSFEIFASK